MQVQLNGFLVVDNEGGVCETDGTALETLVENLLTVDTVEALLTVLRILCSPGG